MSRVSEGDAKVFQSARGSGELWSFASCRKSIRRRLGLWLVYGAKKLADINFQDASWWLARVGQLCEALGSSTLLEETAISLGEKRCMFRAQGWTELLLAESMSSV